MNRIPVILSAAAFLAASASAQACLTATGTSVFAQLIDVSAQFGANDEGETPEIPLGFVFPFVDAAVVCDHIAINANGEIYLTDGTGVVGRALYGISGLAEVRGGVGGSPRIAALGGDGEGNQPTSDILLDTSVAGQVKVTWVDWARFGNLTDAFEMSITLFDSGLVQLDYRDGYTAGAADFSCISAGNDIGTGTETSSDFSVDTFGVITQGLVFQDYGATPMNNQYRSILFTPNLNGFDWLTVCNVIPNPPALHNTFPGGCYPTAEFGTWHQEFATQADAELALDNANLTLIPNGNGGYDTLPGISTFRPTTAATPISLGDDAQLALFLPAAFNYRGTTPAATIYICSNGWISTGTGIASLGGIDAPADFNAVAANAIVAYGEDLDPNNGLDGVISTEYDAGTGTFYVTFEGVPHYPGPVATAGSTTHQYQLELASGICHVVYGDQTVGTTPQTDNVVIGEAAPGTAGVNAIDIAVDLPVSTYAVENVAPGIVLSAGSAPISTPTSGSSVVYSSAGAPDFSPTFLPGFKIGVFIASFLPPVVPGIDLFFLGSPGCPAHVASLDAVEALDPAGNYTFLYPAGIPFGTTLTYQTAFLFDTADPAYPTSVQAANGNTFVMTSSPIEAFISDN